MNSTVDRRQQYYQRLAARGFDPLDFYTRAEKGRRLLTQWHAPKAAPAPPVNVVPIRKRRA